MMYAMVIYKWLFGLVILDSNGNYVALIIIFITLNDHTPISFIYSYEINNIEIISDRGYTEFNKYLSEIISTYESK